MAEKPLEIIVRAKRGQGRSAEWEWKIHRKDDPSPLRMGMTIGAEKTAYKAARHAMMQLIEAQNKKKKK